MKFSHMVGAGLALGIAASQLIAQSFPRRDEQPMRAFSYRTNDEPRAAIGITIAGSVSSRDTLGLLITSVAPGSPAERAGLEEGNRLQAIGGVSLKLSKGDVDDWEMSGVMERRLRRELDKAKPGDNVTVAVYASGQTRTITLKTVSSDALDGSNRIRSRSNEDERASLGMAVGSTGSQRDTLGVFVFSVNDSGPAAKVGIQEGNRIAGLNGVDLRVSGADAGDELLGSAKARRLEREISRLKPGDEVELRVYADGHVRTAKVKAVSASELPRRASVFITGGDGDDHMMMSGMGPMISHLGPMPAMPLDLRFDMPDLSDVGGQVRRSLDGALHVFGRRYY